MESADEHVADCRFLKAVVEPADGTDNRRDVACRGFGCGPSIRHRTIAHLNDRKVFELRCKGCLPKQAPLVAASVGGRPTLLTQRRGWRVKPKRPVVFHAAGVNALGHSAPSGNPGSNVQSISQALQIHYVSSERKSINMASIPCFSATNLEAACRVLCDTGNGLTGPEIGYILSDMKVADVDAGNTKWKRLFNALVSIQNEKQIGNYLIMFINRAMEPARYASKPDLFHWRRDGLNVVLAFVGYGVNERGQVVHTTRETTLEGARARAGRLRSNLEARGTHSEIFKYCRAELLEQNYFHAVFEATKGLADRIRGMSGLTSDGADLVNEAFAVRAPRIWINALQTETEKSEQKGVANLLVGLFGAVRNPLAHAPKVNWTMQEQDALDVFALISFVHRKLDRASTS